MSTVGCLRLCLLDTQALKNKLVEMSIVLVVYVSCQSCRDLLRLPSFWESWST